MSAPIKAGDKLPDAEVQIWTEAGPKTVTAHSLFSGKKSVIFGLPGAYTPTCTAEHCPSYVANSKALKEKGVEFVACVSVNDIFVMHAWGESLKATAHMEFIGDGNAGFSKALGLTHDYSAHFMGLRSLRFALIVQADLTVSYVAIDSNGYGKTSAEAILTQL